MPGERIKKNEEEIINISLKNLRLEKSCKEITLKKRGDNENKCIRSHPVLGVSVSVDCLLVNGWKWDKYCVCSAQCSNHWRDKGKMGGATVV